MNFKTTMIILCALLLAATLAGCSRSGGADYASAINSAAGSAVVGDGGGDGDGNGSGDDSGSNPLNPEPTTIALMGGGLAALALMNRRRRK